MTDVRVAIILALCLTTLSALAPQAAGQSTAPPRDDRPAFAVASIRENRSGSDLQGVRLQPGGRVVVTNFPLRPLIVLAYGLLPQQVTGGPAWLETARFDILAQADGDFAPSPPGGPPGPAQLMLQRLLAERFAVVIRRDTRDMPVYALTVARSDGRLGPRMRAARWDCAALMAAYGRGEGPMPPRDQCGISGGAGRVSAAGITMPMLARLVLSGPAGRIVEDNTGLTGAFDLDLAFTPDLATDPSSASTSASTDQTSLFTALEEQLGLKLVPRRAAVEVLVVDRVERPTEN